MVFSNFSHALSPAIAGALPKGEPFASSVKFLNDYIF